LSVPGVDAFFIGPNDLTNSMGRKPVFESDDPEFTQALRHLLEVGRKYGVASGIHVADAAAAARRRAEGFQMIAVASDAGLMLAKAREAVAALGLGAGTVAVKY
jgi:4-hydroxy-2-oxoheptanedioate aldolase